MILYLHYDVIHSTPITGRNIGNNELYRQCPPRRVKDMCTKGFAKSEFIKIVIKITPVM